MSFLNGVARTIKAVLPQMRKQRSGRIIITASIVSHVSVACAGWYSSIKHAIKGMAEALRQETHHLGIDIVLIEPGAVKTEFDAVSFGILDSIDHPDDYQRLVKGFKRAMANSYANCPGPEGTADVMIKAAAVKKPRARYQTTNDARVLPRLKGLMSDRWFDSLLLYQLYRAADA